MITLMNLIGGGFFLIGVYIVTCIGKAFGRGFMAFIDKAEIKIDRFIAHDEDYKRLGGELNSINQELNDKMNSSKNHNSDSHGEIDIEYFDDLIISSIMSCSNILTSRYGKDLITNLGSDTKLKDNALNQIFFKYESNNESVELSHEDDDFIYLTIMFHDILVRYRLLVLMSNENQDLTLKHELKRISDNYSHTLSQVNISLGKFIKHENIKSVSINNNLIGNMTDNDYQESYSNSISTIREIVEALHNHIVLMQYQDINRTHDVLENELNVIRKHNQNIAGNQDIPMKSADELINETMIHLSGLDKLDSGSNKSDYSNRSSNTCINETEKGYNKVDKLTSDCKIGRFVDDYNYVALFNHINSLPKDRW